jgi:hypothetical protein
MSFEICRKSHFSIFQVYFAQGCQFFKPPKWTLLLRTNMVSHLKTGKTDFGYLNPFENEVKKYRKEKKINKKLATLKINTQGCQSHSFFLFS